MLKFYSLAVYVDFRYDAGESLPRDRTLRARVMTPGSEGPVYGSPLTRRSVRDFASLRTECVKVLHDKCDEITFAFSPLVPVSVYREFQTVVRLRNVA